MKYVCQVTTYCVYDYYGRTQTMDSEDFEDMETLEADSLEEIQEMIGAYKARHHTIGVDRIIDREDFYTWHFDDKVLSGQRVDVGPILEVSNVYEALPEKSSAWKSREQAKFDVMERLAVQKQIEEKKKIEEAEKKRRDSIERAKALLIREGVLKDEDL